MHDKRSPKHGKMFPIVWQCLPGYGIFVPRTMVNVSLKIVNGCMNMVKVLDIVKVSMYMIKVIHDIVIVPMAW
jgi:hypothetical protein